MQEVICFIGVVQAFKLILMDCTRDEGDNNKCDDSGSTDNKQVKRIVKKKNSKE